MVMSSMYVFLLNWRWFGLAWVVKVADILVNWAPIPNCTQMGFCKSKRVSKQEKLEKGFTRAIQALQFAKTFPPTFCTKGYIGVHIHFLLLG